MKNFFKDTCKSIQRLEITKNYDCKTVLKSEDEREPYFVMHMKGDYTVKPIHIAIGLGIIAVVCMASSISGMVKRKK